MAVSRRSFLIGAGSFLSGSFLKNAKSFADATHLPFLVAPQTANKTMFFERVEDHWRLHLGPPQFVIPKPQLLIENYRWHGYRLETDQEIQAFCDDHWLTVEELFQEMDGYSWEDQWEHSFCPEAQAFEFLEKHNVLPAGGNGLREGQVIFESFPNPMSSARWVEVHDPLSLSLLQGRLNELDLGIELKPWSETLGASDHLPLRGRGSRLVLSVDNGWS